MQVVVVVMEKQKDEGLLCGGRVAGKRQGHHRLDPNDARRQSRLREE